MDVARPVRLCVGSAVSVALPGRSDWRLKGNAAVVLAWVALEGQADRRRLSLLLWPASDAAQARSNLRVLVHRINQRFGGELLLGTEHLAFNAALAVVELQDAEAALDEGGPARCELLADADVEAAAGDELLAWLNEARQRLKKLQLDRLGEALAQALAAGRDERAVALLKACLLLDPLSEHRHRQLMEMLASTGDRAAALAAYEHCKGVLLEQLGVLPGLQTRTVHLRILQEQALGPAPSQRPTPKDDGATAFDALARYPLVEREAVLNQAQTALKQGVHVVLQGEPGVGKTRVLSHLVAWAGHDVEAVACRSALRQETYAALAQMLQEVQMRRSAHIGVPEQTELARLAPLAFPGVKPSESALSAPRLYSALRRWWLSLADVSVRLLVLDDLHYADAESQAALASLLQAPPESAGRAPALLLAHRSDSIDAVLDEAITETQARHRARRIDLPRLTPAGVLSLLQSMDAAPGADADSHDLDALASRLHTRSGGNPLFVIELARQSLAQDEVGDMSSVEALLASSLRGCSAAAQELASVAAVAAERFSVELAAAVTGQSALALMPAWQDLQKRGLFAGHGLAHDLVQDAVLSSLPQAIGQALHRQVGQYLESQGVQGQAVLRHWLAAHDADRALPHAVHHLHAVSAAGLQTLQQELDILGLLEQSSDAVLLANLWLTGEFDAGFGGILPAHTWHRVRALRLRVASLPDRQAHAAWMAFTKAQEDWRIERAPRLAYEGLAPVAEGMASQSIERAYVEYELALFALHVTGDARMHLRRASEILAHMQGQRSTERLRREVEATASAYLDPAEGLRAQAARRRAARQRGDLAAAGEADWQMGSLNSGIDNASRALRHFFNAVGAHAPFAAESERWPDVYRAGRVAATAGHYALAQRLLLQVLDERLAPKAKLLTAFLFLRLGDVRQAEIHAGHCSWASVADSFGAQIAYLNVRAELDRRAGRDPLPTMQQQVDQALQSGLGGINRELMAWEIVMRAAPQTERLERAKALLRELRRAAATGARLARALLEIAETLADVDAPQSQSLAAEAARWFRRGATTWELYLPEGLVRCARLIRPADPREADALVHVARRWVHNALRQLPPGAEAGFKHDVAVNRLLLESEESAMSLGSLA